MKRIGLTVILTIVIIALLGAGAYVYSHKESGFVSGGIVKDNSSVSDFSAVFLTNGQVYFGKIYRDSGDLDLRDIYYLQVSSQQVQGNQNTQSTAQPNIQLVKLGQELHGPNDRMVINRQQVLFTESLKSDSKVVKAISEFTNK